jgi:hypothetical protein
MTSSDRRRPLPALAFLVALTLLSGLVWYRVLHRDGSAAQTPSAAPCTTTTTTAAPTALPRPGAVSVLVLNSTQRNGLAAGTGKALARAGFTISGENNDDPSYGGHGVIRGVAEIRYDPAHRAAATLLSYYVRGAKLVQTESSRNAVIVALGRKFTKLAPPASVRRALRAHAEAARPTPSPAPSTAASSTGTASASCAG